MNEIEEVLGELLDATGASRVTLRRDVPGEVVFPVTDEVLAPGAPSLREERTVDLRTQPVAIEVGAGRQVVQDDCASAHDDPAFLRMLDVYGGLAAQIVTPVVLDGVVRGIVSLHQLDRPRRWRDVEIAAATRTAERVADLLEAA